MGKGLSPGQGVLFRLQGRSLEELRRPLYKRPRLPVQINPLMRNNMSMQGANCAGINTTDLWSQMLALVNRRRCSTCATFTGSAVSLGPSQPRRRARPQSGHQFINVRRPNFLRRRSSTLGRCEKHAVVPPETRTRRFRPYLPPGKAGLQTLLNIDPLAPSAS